MEEPEQNVATTSMPKPAALQAIEAGTPIRRRA